MFQSILLFIAVVITILLNINKTGCLKREIFILDKEITKVYRGMAIIFVMIQHCAGHFGTNIFTTMGGIGVAIFLLLSGFGLTESFKKKGIGGFLQGRLKRVWLPFALFYVGVYMLYDNHDWQNLVLNVLSVRQDDYWYVHYMLRCYLVFWIAFRLSYRYRWWIFVAFSLYTFLGMEGCRIEQWLTFPFGVLMSERKEWLMTLTRKKVIQIAIIAGIIGIMALAVKQMSIVREQMGTWVYQLVETFIKLPLGIFVIAILWLLPSRLIIGNRMLTLCGLLSYELYLVHIQMLGLANSCVSAFVMLVISIMIAYSLQRFLNLKRIIQH